jgi:hypothetical protein
MDDKRELLKLRQGLVSAEETQLEVEKPPHIERPVGFTAVTSNFYYHHKLHLVIGGFFLSVIAVFIYLAATDEKPDISILLLSDNVDTSLFFFFEQGELRANIEQFVPDFNENGKILAACLHIDLVTEGRDPQAVHGNHIKLFGEMQGANALIFIGNRQVLESVPFGELALEDFYLDLSERFPDDENVSERFFYRVNSTVLADGMYEERPLPEDLYLAVRTNLDTARLTPNRAEQRLVEALIVLDNIINNLPQNQ